MKPPVCILFSRTCVPKNLLHHGGAMKVAISEIRCRLPSSLRPDPGGSCLFGRDPEGLVQMLR
jgi:hypothetical protein